MKMYTRILNIPFVRKYPLLSLFVFYFSIIVIAYLPLFFSYFQQDEWYFFAYFSKFLHIPFGGLQAFIAPFLDPQTFAFHITPITSFLWYFEYKLFNLNFIVYVLLSLTLHSINTLLVSVISYRLLANKHIAFIAGVFFALSASHYQAISWISTHVNTQIALLFACLSLLSFLTFLQKNEGKYNFLSILFFILSLLTKEIAVFFVIFYPLLVVTRSSWKKILVTKGFLLASITFLAIRIATPYIFSTLFHIKTFSAIVGPETTILTTLYYSISLSLKALAQTYFSGIDFIAVSERFTDIAYPQYTAQKAVRGIDYLTFTQSASLDIVLYGLGFIILCIVLVLFFLIKDNKTQKVLQLMASFFLLSIIPFVILAGKLQALFPYLSTIDSRHLYMTSLSSSMLFGIALDQLRKFIQGKKKQINYFSYSIYFLLVIWAGSQIVTVHSYINKENIYAQDRKAIVDAWYFSKEKLNKKNVFYSESNVALFGFADLMLPFQNNPGQIILTMYGHDQKIPEEFLTTKFLSKKLTEEWYSSFNNMEIGYLLNKKTLLHNVVKNNIAPEDIVSVYYDGVNHTVSNNTIDIQYMIRKYLKTRNSFKGWLTYEDANSRYNFIYPPSYILEKITGQSATSGIQVVDNGIPLMKVYTYTYTPGTPVTEFVSKLKNDQGEVYGENYQIRNLSVGATDNYTTVRVEEGNYEKFYFTTTTTDELKEFVLLKGEYMTQNQIEYIKNLLAFMEFTN